MICRACGHTGLDCWLDLGNQPPANAFRLPHHPEPKTYPLAVARCMRCHLSQLTLDLPPSELYAGYAFRSGVSKTFSDHCDDLVSYALNIIEKPSAVLDIGANDLTLMRAFWLHEVEWPQITGVDPAPALTERDRGTVVEGYFPDVQLPHDRYDIVTTVNTLNAIPDLNGFVAGVAARLAPNGIWIVEVPYLVDVLRRLEVDTIYHEHRTYWLVSPFTDLVRKHGLEVLDVHHKPIHGGSLRFTVGRASDYPHANGPIPWTWWEETDGYLSSEAYAQIGFRMHCWKFELQRLMTQDPSIVPSSADASLGQIRTLTGVTRTWAGFGAAAKSTVLASLCGMTKTQIRYIVDDTYSKQGRVTPWGVPVVPPSELKEHPVEGIIVFAWNYADECVRRLKQLDWHGRVLIPLPETRELML